VTIKNLREANRALLSYADRSPKIGKNFTLERVLPLMEVAGNPQDHLKVIHIAGTSGKTSTAYFTTALLKASGIKVGTTISPHVDSVTERIQINGVPLSEDIFCRELGKFLEIVERAQQHPSYFELLYAFSLWVFERHKVDYAVLETGVGGLYDATNVTARPDKVCIITDIGFDHMHLLGSTLAKIASQKIGIVHKQNVVFMYEQTEEVMEVVRNWTTKQQAPVHLVEERSGRVMKNSNTIADYQQRNWHLAYNVYQYLERRDNLQHVTRQVLQETQGILIPGRMDIRQVQGKTLVMDGAHNVQEITAFIASFQKLYPDVKPAVLLSLKHNKDYEDIAQLLIPFAGLTIVTSFATTQDSKIRSVDPEILAASLRRAGAKHLKVIPNHNKAIKALLAAPEQVCVITGSFYLLGRIRNNKHLV
jgi:dihydrofolate synthase / folylpolyglutamate synthase